MHRALLLPEVVAAVVHSESGEPGYLHTCLLVNRLFFQETSRLLWYGCGSRYNSATAGHVTPGIRQLAEISQRSRARAQLYADCVHILYFAEPTEEWPYGDEARWHDDLACLRYPHLREVAFFESDNAETLNKGDVVIRYAQQQPGLQGFDLSRGSALSDAFLDQLGARCPKLQHLHLCSPSNTITQEGLLRFLRSFATLKSLTLDAGFRDLWTRAAFRAVAKYTDLELLHLSAIHDDWIQGDEPVFPSLKHLYTVISTSGVGLLSRILPNLATFHATVLQPCTSLESFANYPRLQDLRLRFEGSASFGGADLLLIAENCPELEAIVADELHEVRVEGLDDAMMDQIASHLPNIKEFKLFNFQSSLRPLTLHSIESLGRYCPKLRDLGLSNISIDWDGAGLVSKSIWSLDLGLSLDHNRLWPEGHDPDDGDTGHPSKEQVRELAESFARRLPNMECFSLDNGGPGEEEFSDRLGDFISERDYVR